MLDLQKEFVGNRERFEIKDKKQETEIKRNEALIRTQ